MSTIPAPPLRHRFAAMASDCEIVLASARPDAAWQAHARQAATAAQAEVQRIAARYSRYADAAGSSVLWQINAAAGSGQWVAVDEECAGLLSFADQLHQASGGLFDISSGVLGQAWDWRRARLPEPEHLAALRARVGWQRVEWDASARRIRLPEPGMALDFGGFGKEFAADRAHAVLTQHGLAHGFVNLGGDIRVLGPQPDGRPWRFAIQHPRQPGQTIAAIELGQGALATSGDYERFFELDGRRYCHLLNPHTGWPVAHWQSVSVVAPVCSAAGALSTLVMLAEARGLALLQAQATQAPAMTWLAVGPQGELISAAGPAAPGG